MSETVYTYREQWTKGAEKPVVVREVYHPPVFPVRLFRARRNETKRWLLAKPGGWQTEQKAHPRPGVMSAEEMALGQEEPVESQAETPHEEDVPGKKVKWDRKYREQDEPCHPLPYDWVEQKCHATKFADAKEFADFLKQSENAFDDYERRTGKNVSRYRYEPGTITLTKE